MMHAISAGLANLKNPAVLAPEIRARLVSHMRKNAATYSKEWDAEMPDLSVGDDFLKYLAEVEKDGAWCSLLELKAAARVFDVRLIVSTNPEELEPVSIHNQQKKRIIVMRLNGRHYDLLAATDKKLPIKNRPEEVFCRYLGGGVANDAASVWTRTSQGSGSAGKSVWTELSGPRAVGLPCGR